METKVKALGHPVHPMVIVFPLGLLTTAVIFDIVYLINGRVGFQVAAAYTIGVGVLGGLVAAVFGLVDWLGIPRGTRARSVGALHGIGNVVVVALFAVSWFLRSSNTLWHASSWALACSFAGVALALATSWLGGELVDRLGVGVRDDANLNAPSSLRSAIPGRFGLSGSGAPHHR